MAVLAAGTVTVDWSYKPRGRAGVAVAGQVKIGRRDTVLRPQELGLRTIRSLVLTPMMGSTNLIGSYIGYRNTVLETYIGSLGVLDTSTGLGSSLGNYARIRAVAYKGTVTHSSPGTLVAGCTGTVLPGSIRASFLAFGE